MPSLARWCFRHRAFVIASWIALAALINVVHSATGSNYRNDFSLPHTESFDAVRLLQSSARRESGESAQVVIGARQGRVTDPAVRAAVARLLARLSTFPHVTDIVSPYTQDGARQTSPDGRVAFATVTFDVRGSQIESGTAQKFVGQVTRASGSAAEFEVGGRVGDAGRGRGDSAGLPFGFLTAGLVLFLVFGSFLAMLLPLFTAGVSIGAGIGSVGLLSHVISMADFANQLALLIGLGVGVDYALFILTRYRQAVLRGLSREDAIAEAVDTSGRAVVFAGIIVCIAMLGLFAVGVSFLYGVAVAAAVTVAFTVLAAITLLPALIGFFGRLVLRRRDRRALAAGHAATATDESPGWRRWTGVLDGRPALFAAGGILVMVLLAIPFFGMRLGASDAGSDPSGSTTRKAYDLLAKGFGPGYNGPLELVAVVRSRAQAASFVAAARSAAATAGATGGGRARFIPVPTSQGGGAVGLAQVYPRGSPQNASTSRLLDRLRTSVLPAAERGSGLRVLVGGETAIYEDFATLLGGKLPQFIAIVIAFSFVLLLAVFRSIAIPLTAAVMNLLSTGAALGIVTAIFQQGWGASLIGIDRTGPIQSFLPVLMFPILFGLSMDYEVFLVSRIYEEWHRRRDNREAVAHGLAATGRTINAAAAIMVLVFAGFVLGGERIIELFGVGLASAVLLDAVIVRSVIVPAVMLLLGERNWFLPGRLERRVPHLKIEGARSPRSPQADSAVSSA